MNEQDLNNLAGIRPRDDKDSNEDLARIANLQAKTIDGAMRNAREAELKERARCAIAELEKRQADAHSRLYGGVLTTGPRDDAEMLAAYHGTRPAMAQDVAALARELEGLARHVGELGRQVEALTTAHGRFDEEDIDLIKAHVRHPGALEAAKLRETIRCALLAVRNGHMTVAAEILGASDAKG